MLRLVLLVLSASRVLKVRRDVRELKALKELKALRARKDVKVTLDNKVHKACRVFRVLLVIEVVCLISLAIQLLIVILELERYATTIQPCPQFLSCSLTMSICLATVKLRGILFGMIQTIQQLKVI
jgi:hypothetical protein